MDTDSGRIYEPDELEKRLRALEHKDVIDAHQLQFQQQLARGKIVEVSEQVAHTMRLGQRERERRDRRRKAQKQSRKQNR